jgi:DsrE/DsrF-like family
MKEYRMSKTAVVVMSDPDGSKDESLGRLFNALFLTYELQRKEADVVLVFQAAGSRWPARIVLPDHPANALYREVQTKVAGISCGCATVFGAADAATAAGFTLVKDGDVPGTGGVLDLSRYVSEGYAIVTF